MKFYVTANWQLLTSLIALFSLYCFFVTKTTSGLILKILRLSGVFIILFLITRPTAVKVEVFEKKPEVAVLLDASPSMAQPEFPNSKISKMDNALIWLRKNADFLQKHSQVKYYYFADKTYLMDLSTKTLNVLGYESDFTNSVSELLSENLHPPDKILVITDGLSEEKYGNEYLCRELENKIDFIGAGDYQVKKLFEITEVSFPSFAFVHIPFNISLKINVNEFLGKNIFIKLVDENNKVIAKKTEFPSFSQLIKEESGRFIIHTTFTVKAESVGTKYYSICVSSKKDKICEVTKDFTVQVIREKTRVMYLCGKPDFEYAALRDYLKNSTNIELISFVILRNPEDAVKVSDLELSLIPFPANEIFVKDISHFDVFILHNFDFRKFAINETYMTSLENFVKNGGALLVIGGDNSFGSANYAEFAALKRMMPVEINNSIDYLPQEIQVEALKHPLSDITSNWEESVKLWKNVTMLSGFNAFKDVRDGAKTILRYKTNDGKIFPILVERNYGRGRVLVLASPSTWRWKMAEGYIWKLSGFYSMFWRRMIRYLDGSLDLKKVQLNATDLKTFNPKIVLRVLDENYSPVKADSIEINSTLFHNKDIHLMEFKFIEPGIFESQIKPAYYGKYKIQALVKLKNTFIGSDEIKFTIENPAYEFVPARKDLLANVAKKYKGIYRSIGEAKIEEFLKNLPPSKYQENIVAKTDLWNLKTVMIILVGIFSIEWLIRKLSGLS